jgi:transaldolase
MKRKTAVATGALDFDDAVVALATARGFPEAPRPASSPLLAALGAAGTSHVYADTASVAELQGLLDVGEGRTIREVDGNTANQPLVERVLGDYLDGAPVGEWVKALREHRPGLPDAQLLPILYAVVCGRIGNDFSKNFACHRSWQVSLQLHMDLVADPEEALRVGGHLRRMVASAFVKVPFAPHAPGMLLVARDLERRYVPVNLTSTFSARQVAVAALLCDATRTNVFMGRLNQGLRAELVGEHVDLCAQRLLRGLREDPGSKTQLIVASIHDWQTFPRTAGCDVYTAPCEVLRAFLEQDEVEPDALENRLHTSYEDRLGIPSEVEERLGREAIGRLWTVEPEFLDFLREYRATEEFRGLEPAAGGETLARRFEEAGFGDFFLAPDAAGWEQVRAGKLPDLDAPITREAALDTLYSLKADADFAAHQASMDAVFQECLRTL